MRGVGTLSHTIFDPPSSLPHHPLPAPRPPHTHRQVRTRNADVYITTHEHLAISKVTAPDDFYVLAAPCVGFKGHEFCAAVGSGGNLVPSGGLRKMHSDMEAQLLWETSGSGAGGSRDNETTASTIQQSSLASAAASSHDNTSGNRSGRGGNSSNATGNAASVSAGPPAEKVRQTVFYDVWLHPSTAVRLLHPPRPDLCSMSHPSPYP